MAAWFRKEKKPRQPRRERLEIPPDVWEKCEACGHTDIGEKFVPAFCREARIETTTGTVHFDADGRHEYPGRKRDAGTRFSAVIDCNESISGYFGLPVADWVFGTCVIPQTIYAENEEWTPDKFRSPAPRAIIRGYVRWSSSIARGRAGSAISRMPRAIAPEVTITTLSPPLERAATLLLAQSLRPRRSSQ